MYSKAEMNGMSDCEEADTSEEEVEDDAEIVPTCNEYSNLEFDLKNRISKEVDKFVSQYSKTWSPKSISSKFSHAMFLISARTVLRRAKSGNKESTIDDARCVDITSFIQLTGVVPSCDDEDKIHHPVTWNVHGYNPRFKVVLEPLEERKDFKPDLIEFREFLEHLLEQNLIPNFESTNPIGNSSRFGKSILKMTTMSSKEILNIDKIIGTLARRLLHANAVLLEVEVTSVRAIKIFTKKLSKQPLYFKQCRILLFENTISHVRKFFAAYEISPSTFIQLNQNDVQNQTKTEKENMMSVLNVSCDQICGFTLSEKNMRLSVILRCLSFDIECVNPSSETEEFQQFPNRHHSLQFRELGPIMQIGVQAVDLKIYPLATELKDTVEIIRDNKFFLYIGDVLLDLHNVTTFKVSNSTRSNNHGQLGASSDSLKSLDDEEVVLLAGFQQLLIQLNPDILTGYNISQFDLPFIKFRKEILEAKYGKINFLMNYGRNSESSFTMKTLSAFRRLNVPSESCYNCKISGRAVFDMYSFFLNFTTGKRLSLKEVARRNLDMKMQKLLPPQGEFIISNGFDILASKEKLENIANYCLRDAELPTVLLLKPKLEDLKAKRILMAPLIYAIQRSRDTSNTLQSIASKSNHHKDCVKIYYLNAKRKRALGRNTP